MLSWPIASGEGMTLWKRIKGPFSAEGHFQNKYVSQLLCYIFADILIRAAEDGSYHGRPFLEIWVNEHTKLIQLLWYTIPEDYGASYFVAVYSEWLEQDGCFGNLGLRSSGQSCLCTDILYHSGPPLELVLFFAPSRHSFSRSLVKPGKTNGN